MRRKKACDLGRVEITDHALTAPPVVTVAIFRNEVPPESHLRFQRGANLVEQILATGTLRCFPDVARVLVRVTIETPRGRRVVSVKIAFGKLDRGAIEQLVEKRAIV